MIPDDEPHQKKKGKQPVKGSFEIDPTMAISAGAITLLENIDNTTIVHNTVS